MPSTNEIRQSFLDSFARHGHQVVPSSPLVPRNDPTLLFTNAGMVQFKNVFTGAEQRPYNRAATSQKCVRAGGKHNDLDNVGYTARHHTFFEMLGNFSFGDYFKDLAIELAWKLVTEEFAVPKDRLLVTVYHDDEEAFGFWRKIAGLPEERIIRIATSDNFWSMGDTGPCGPCSEIFFDHGPGIPGGPPGSPDEDGDRFIEIWNLVFMQFEQRSPGDRVALPKPSIDTGMGLERIAALLQGKHDNYDIDLMRHLIEASAEASGTEPDGPHKVSHRVIADHLRASCFLIADGVLPSNEGRGYVLRRIMRRAMRHAHLMGCEEPLLWRLVPALIAEMGRPYPELNRAEVLVTQTLELEEKRFQQTLDRGLRLLSDEVERLGSGESLPGEVAFKLYDTFGFPIDLTQDALRSEGRDVDMDGFQAAMERQRQDARKAWAGSGEAATGTLWLGLRDRLGATEFLGYDVDAAEGIVQALVRDGAEVESLQAGEDGAVVANQTPFYGESGGQMGDTGSLVTADGAEFTVTDTQKMAGGLHVHLGRLERGSLKAGDILQMRIEDGRRTGLRAHHSATHLLHRALRTHLGDHVAQKGSLVAPDRLRFDISHPAAIPAVELARVEADVNGQILANRDVQTKLMTPEDAIEAGALALFGEKYGEEVRVVSMGSDAELATPYSVELCGGTHVRRTGDIGLFKILGESAVGAGVRRIEAVTGEAARRWYAARDAALSETATLLKAQPEEVPARVARLVEEARGMEREIAALRRKLATGEGGTEQRHVAGVVLAAKKLDDVPAKDLRGMADDIKRQIGTGVVALAAANDGKVALVVAVTDDLAGRLSAVDLVRAGAAAVGGAGGGGRPNFAQAGGPDAGQIDAAFEAVADAMKAGLAA